MQFLLRLHPSNCVSVFNFKKKWQATTTKKSYIVCFPWCVRFTCLSDVSQSCRRFYMLGMRVINGVQAWNSRSMSESWQPCILEFKRSKNSFIWKKKKQTCSFDKNNEKIHHPHHPLPPLPVSGCDFVIEIVSLYLKALIGDPKFQKFTFFQSPRFFCIVRENFTVINYLWYNSSHGNSIFLEIETILCCFELIFTVKN